jgi:hypothetical protein
MKDTIQRHIFTFYLLMTAASLVTQLLIAGFIIGMNWEVIQFMDQLLRKLKMPALLRDSGRANGGSANMLVIDQLMHILAALCG